MVRDDSRPLHCSCFNHMEIKYNLKEIYWRPILKIKAQGLLCPEPIMMLHKAIQDAQEGERIELYATDPSTEKDVERFCKFLGHFG